MPEDAATVPGHPVLQGIGDAVYYTFVLLAQLQDFRHSGHESLGLGLLREHNSRDVILGIPRTPGEDTIPVVHLHGSKLRLNMAAQDEGRTHACGFDIPPSGDLREPVRSATPSLCFQNDHIDCQAAHVQLYKSCRGYNTHSGGEQLRQYTGRHGSQGVYRYRARKLLENVTCEVQPS